MSLSACGDMYRIESVNKGVIGRLYKVLRIVVVLRTIAIQLRAPHLAWEQVWELESALRSTFRSQNGKATR